MVLKIMKIYKYFVFPSEKAYSAFFSSDWQCVPTVQRIVLQQSVQLKYKHVTEARNPIAIKIYIYILLKLGSNNRIGFSEINQKGFIL